MARRSVFAFFLTAIVFFLLGASGVYLALSIPNDIRAEAMLKEARSDLRTGKRDQAREKFETVVKNYPRTDAAAAAAYALFRLLDSERKQLAAEVEKLQGERAILRKQVGDLGQQVAVASKKAEEAAARPAPPPPSPRVTRKPTPARRTSTRRRRG